MGQNTQHIHNEHGGDGADKDKMRELKVELEERDKEVGGSECWDGVRKV